MTAPDDGQTTGKDDNGLLLSTRGKGGKPRHSIYANVTSTNKRLNFEAAPWIAYVRFNDPEMIELNREYTGEKYGIGFPNYFAIGEFGDERDAAYIGQRFSENMEDNLLAALIDHEEFSESIPHWSHEAPDLPRKEFIQMEPPKKAIKPFNPKRAEKEIDVLAGDFKTYQINNQNTKIIMGNMEELVQSGMNYHDAAIQAAEQFKR